MSLKTIILITGANSGVGLDSTAHLVAASPDYHVIMGCRSADKGQQALKHVRARQPAGSASLLELDVTSDAWIAAAAARIAADFGVPDVLVNVLVNNAGVERTRHGEPLREALLNTFQTNTFGPMVLTDALAPLLQRSRDPRIINVSSTLGSVTARSDPASPSYAAAFDTYRMSKAALNMLSACQLFQYKPWGCKVWSYCPGYIVTNLTGASDAALEERRQRGAESPETSAVGLLEIVRGDRDVDVGCFVLRHGATSPW